jgi:hypothetical protein
MSILDGCYMIITSVRRMRDVREWKAPSSDSKTEVL